jgi:hypothetical protein
MSRIAPDTTMQTLLQLAENISAPHETRREATAKIDARLYELPGDVMKAYSLRLASVRGTLSQTEGETQTLVDTHVLTMLADLTTRVEVLEKKAKAAGPSPEDAGELVLQNSLFETQVPSGQATAVGIGGAITALRSGVPNWNGATEPVNENGGNGALSASVTTKTL